MHEDEKKCCGEEKMVGNTYSPEKPKTFNECPIEEKIYRLQQELMQVRQSAIWMARTNSELRQEIEKLKNHQHTEQGLCVVPLNNSNNYGVDGASIGRGFDPLA